MPAGHADGALAAAEVADAGSALLRAADDAGRIPALAADVTVLAALAAAVCAGRTAGSSRATCFAQLSPLAAQTTNTRP
jgi:hypothetical protein